MNLVKTWEGRLEAYGIGNFRFHEPVREMCFEAQPKTVKCRWARQLMYDTPAGCKGLPIKHHTVLITSIFFATQECFHFNN